MVKLTRVLVIFGCLGYLASPVLAKYVPAKEQVIKIGNGTEPRELDPGTSTGVPESHIEDNLFEGLCARDPFTSEPIPGAAESWTISSDGKVYTFKLRPNLKWSDGKPLTADDFVYSWRRVVDPKTASEYAYQLYYVKNGKGINEGKIKDKTQLGVVAKDPRTLVVTLGASTPYFLHLAAFHTLYPVPQHVIAKYPDQEWTKEGRMVSNGAFKLAEWRVNKHIKIIPNEHYWDKGKVKIKAAYFLPIENVNTEEQAFTSGQLHMTNSVPSLKLPMWKKKRMENPQTAHYHSTPLLGTYYYRVNVTKPALKDKRVRRALSMTISRQLIVDKITKGGQIPAGSFVPPNTAGYTHPSKLNATVTEKDIATAKELLKQAGFPDGKGLPKIELLYNTSESHKKVAIAIQQMWKKNLGIEVSILNQEWKVFLNTVRDLKYDLSRGGWIGDYLDPNTFLDMYVSYNPNNDVGWKNKEYDTYIEKAGLETDKMKRLEYFHKAETILMDELPIIPIYHYTNNKLVSLKIKMFGADGKIREWASNISDRIPLKYYVMVN